MTRRCYCEQCSTTPRPTYTREHLRACEVRWVAALPRGQRADYLERIGIRRGLDAAVELRQAVAKLPTP